MSPTDLHAFTAAALAESSGALKLPLAMLLVFGSAKLLDEVFQRLRQPGIVGQILAGILIGPSVLRWMAPNEFLSALAELGVMFLLFSVGLEIRAPELTKVGRKAVVVAVLGVVVPFVAGWAILRAWGAPQIESIFVGAALVATSVGITAQVLAAKGLLQETASRIILGAAVVDDILGLLILSVVSSLARGKLNLLELAITAALAISFAVVAVKWGAKAVGNLVPRVQQKLRGGEAQFTLALVVMFGLAVLAIYAGVAAIIGAFFAGLVLSGNVEQRVHDLTQGVTELLVPFFLVGIGLHLDLSAFASRQTILLALVVVVAAVASKFLGCGLGALSLGWVDAARVGVGMVPRGEVGMVVAQIGLSLGVIPPHVYGVVVLMSVATTLVAPPLLSLTFRNLRSAVPSEQ
jgi:Kef-type K+ transport system membrane component KefB